MEARVLEDEWLASALARTRRRLEGGWRERMPWRRGLWATARPSYRRLPLPQGFVLVHVDVPGGRRRVALCEGAGRPLLILPGAYADLGEALFCRLAEAASLGGRPVALLEDQLASSTLRLSEGHWVSFAEQGQQVQHVARLFSSRPDVLALSMGAMVALHAPAGTWHRLAAWSAVVDDATLACVRRSRMLSWHYRREHARSFRAAGIEPPAPYAALERLFQGAPAPRPSCPALFVHAADDPVAPVASIRRLIAHPLITRWGGHLGFGAARGVSVYLSPFEGALEPAQLQPEVSAASGSRPGAGRTGGR